MDQIRAATPTLKAIHQLTERGILTDELAAVRETDVFRLRRGLCLPSAAAAAINHVKEQRFIGDSDEDAPLSVGDMYRTLVPYHGRVIKYPDGSEKVWKFATPQGDVYHQAIVAFSKAVGVPAMAIGSFKSVGEFQGLFNGDPRSGVAVSLDNRFVAEQTLAGRSDLIMTTNEETFIKIDGANGLETRKFEHGRHVVFLSGITENGDAIIYDSFRLPQMGEQDLVLTIPVPVVDKYLNYFTGGASRGIIFSRSEANLEPYGVLSGGSVPPESVVEEIRQSLVTGV